MIGYRMPTHVRLTPGCLAELPAVVDSLAGRSVLLVTDSGLEATEWPDLVRRSLAGLRCESFAGVEANPRTTTAERAAEQLRDSKLEIVIGLGGGSVLDCAKAASMLATNPGPTDVYEGRNRFAHRPLPFIALPSTCGTGSEVTWVSVLSDRKSRRKISIKGEAMFPTQALVDADLLRALPPALIATTGLDALTHAVEATTGTARNPVSDALAERAIGLLLEYLPRAVSDSRSDDQAREAVMRASTLAGLSFGNADVAAVHCLSESLGGLYDLPHGLLNAVLLVPVLRSHGEAIHPRLAELQRQIDPGNSNARAPDAELAEHFLHTLVSLVAKLEVPTFAQLEIPRADFEQIAERAFLNGSNSSNPRPMTATDYSEILISL